MTDINHHLTRAADAVAAAAAAPLSAKRAMLAALLIDAAADAMFAASGEDDVLAFRARLAGSEALGLVFALCALRPDGPMLVTEAVEVPIADYPALRTEDFMVSLYNGRTVMRVLIAVGAARHDVHEVLARALEDLQSAPPPP